MNSLIRSAPLLAAAIAVCALTGLYLLGGGLWLCLIGGSFYYVVAGVLLLATAVLLLRRQAMALTVYAVLLLGTMVWAVQEAGFDFWALARVGIFWCPSASCLPCRGSHATCTLPAPPPVCPCSVRLPPQWLWLAPP